jgi:hypothetical protein
MENKVLSAVLSQMLHSVYSQNKCAMLGYCARDTALAYQKEADLLKKCLKEAGYQMEKSFEWYNISTGSRCTTATYYTDISCSVCGAPPEDIEAFQKVGFEWLTGSNTMHYEFQRERPTRVVADSTEITGDDF